MPGRSGSRGSSARHATSMPAIAVWQKKRNTSPTTLRGRMSQLCGGIRRRLAQAAAMAAAIPAARSATAASVRTSQNPKNATVRRIAENAMRAGLSSPPSASASGCRSLGGFMASGRFTGSLDLRNFDPCGRTVRWFLSAEPSHIQRRQEDEGQDGRDEQSSHDGKGHRAPKYRWRDRDHAENRRHGCQHDRTEAGTSRIDRRRPNVLSLRALPFDLTDQNHGILGDHSDQRQDAKNSDEAERLAGQQKRRDNADEAERRHTENQEQPLEALQLGHQDCEHQ